MTNLPTIRCPHCQSADVEPQRATWHCNSCGRDFEEAAVEMPPPPARPKAKKRG
jgi:ribosomal protein L37AE/L43A